MPAAAAGSVLNPSSASRALVRGNIRELFHVGQSCHTGACGTEPLRQRAPRDAGSAVVASSECWVKLAAAIGGKRLRRGSGNPVRVKAPSGSRRAGRPVTLLAHEISFRRQWRDREGSLGAHGLGFWIFASFFYDYATDTGRGRTGSPSRMLSLRAPRFTVFLWHVPSSREGFEGPLSGARLASGNEATSPRQHVASSDLSPATQSAGTKSYSQTCPDNTSATWPQGPRFRASAPKTTSEAPRRLIKSTICFEKRVFTAGWKKTWPHSASQRFSVLFHCLPEGFPEPEEHLSPVSNLRWHRPRHPSARGFLRLHVCPVPPPAPSPTASAPGGELKTV